ncbi:MAG: VCBS repeat-containing protein [Desulfovibrionaceae bacterium]|nr:VCBS repeat-containing protein [Desulfovibrionaceae bacterium]
MTRKRLFIALIAAAAMLLMAGTALAQGAKSFAVLPFKYTGPQKYSYFGKAFQASLENDLEWIGHVESATKNVDAVPVPGNQGDALNQLRSLGVDYLVYGDIAILNKDAHINLSVIGASGKYWSTKGKMGIDEITGWLEEQSGIIQGDAFNRPGYGSAEKEKKDKAPTQTAGPTASSFIVGGNDGYQSATLNPQFKYEGGTESVGRWRSQTLRYASYSMVVADGDADGKNEVFILQTSAISAYRFRGGKLEHLDTFDLPKNLMSIRLEIADINRDGMPEFVVGAYQYDSQYSDSAPEGTPRSSILSFEGGKFRYTVKKYPKFLGVLRLPPSYLPILCAQNKGQRHLFAPVIHEAFIKGDSIELGQRLQAPPFGNVYNMIYMPKELGYQIIVLSNKHKLVTYSQAFERLNESEESYNSSGVAIAMQNTMVGLGNSNRDTYIEMYNIPFRMITAPLTSKRYELLLNKDLSAVAQLVSNYHYYSQGEIHSLVWDEVGLNLAWKTRRIKGQVSDIALADLNNDGKKQLCVLVNTFVGLGYSNRKTMVLAYDLNL